MLLRASALRRVVSLQRASLSKQANFLPNALANYESKVFSDDQQKKEFGEDLFKKLKDASLTGKPLSKDDANAIAKGLQRWAHEKGAINYVHWFSPIRGENAEKHDGFIDIDFQNGKIKAGDFSGSKLFQGETDGSSFPNGSLRATHAAAAYTAWDTTSPPFIKGDSLFIPSSFVAWTGEALDEKTPLLRSQAAVNEQGLRLLRILGDKESKRVISNVGWEQEFHILDIDDYLNRPDLVHVGRTLIGAAPIRGQQTSLNYFGSVPLRIKAFFEDAQAELWSLGVSISTFHNEVAPAQHETAPIFSITNIAADQNTLTMKTLREVAFRHGLAVIFHEKPFKGLNGNGKHNNWGLNTDTGHNLFVPGNSEESQRRFTTVLSALIRGINLYSDVLRASVSGAANDHRLGAQEAPPAIISIYPGKRLTSHLESVIKGGALSGYGSGEQEYLKFGSPNVLDIKRPLEDRNRTAPFPYCGNRWEFRAVGGSQNISFPLTTLNTIIADSMKHLSNKIEEYSGDVRRAVSETLKDNFRIVFNGNGYSQEWLDEAARRGLPNLKNTPESLEALGAQKNVDLFSSLNVLSPREFHARRSIMYQAYINQIKMESNCLVDMMRTGVIPAILKDSEKGNSVLHAEPSVAKYDQNKRIIYANLIKETEALEELIQHFSDDDSHGGGSEDAEKKDAEHSLKVLKQMAEVRNLSDKAEGLCEDSLWPYPKYNEFLYRHHHQGESTF